MVTIRCTQNLLKALNVKPVERTQPPTAKLGDWYAKPVETVAGDLIVCMSSLTYLSVAIPMSQMPLFPFTFICASTTSCAIWVLRRRSHPKKWSTTRKCAMSVLRVTNFGEFSTTSPATIKRSPTHR